MDRVKERPSKKLLEDSAAAYTENPSEEGLSKVISAGGGLVRHFAFALTGGFHNEDVIQAGYEGLIKAVKNFKRDRGYAFSTYAGHCIMGEIRHYIRREDSYYKPGCIADLQGRAEELIESHYKQTGWIPTLEYLADRLNVREEGIEEIMQAGLVELDKIDLSKISSLRYESFKLPIEDKLLLSQAFNKLNGIQRKVIYLLFYRDMTQQQAAEVLGLNQRKVSRVLHSCLASLKKDFYEAI